MVVFYLPPARDFFVVAFLTVARFLVFFPLASIFLPVACNLPEAFLLTNFPAAAFLVMTFFLITFPVTDFFPVACFI